MAPNVFADGGSDRLIRYRVIAFVCAIIIAGAWSIAYSQAARIVTWQWYTLTLLTLADIVIFWRWFRFARTTTLGITAAALTIAMMLLITF
ncbi:MAG: hypothetical protein M3126_00935 [Candidatus Eremiobacteraeota bacterium]|nr:hypothetical protein [Candidatus Eremiobacteraeota bacterium]